MKSKLLIAAVAANLVSAVGCGKKEKESDISVKFKNIDAASTALTESTLGITDSNASTLRSMNPVSFKFPIKHIGLTGTDIEYTSIYSCDGMTAEACYVDLADSNAVKALTSGTVAVSYKEGSSPKVEQFSVVVDPACVESSELKTFNVLVKGTVDVAGTTYYTSATDPTGRLMTTDKTYYTEVPVPMKTCTMFWKLATPVAVDDGSAVVSLFVSTKDVVWVNTASTTSDTDSCASESKSSSGSYICATYAVPFPYVGDAEPTLDTFKITEDSTGYLGRVHTATYQGTPIGVFARQYFDGSATSSWQCRTGSWAEGISKNADGSYTVKIAENDGTHVMFDAFKFEKHTGSCYYRDGTRYSYTAEKQ